MVIQDGPRYKIWKKYSLNVYDESKFQPIGSEVLLHERRCKKQQELFGYKDLWDHKLRRERLELYFALINKP